jgi:hypothetical protein
MRDAISFLGHLHSLQNRFVQTTLHFVNGTIASFAVGNMSNFEHWPPQQHADPEQY